MNRREGIESAIQFNRDQMHQVSQFAPGGEGIIERLLARERDLYAELDVINAEQEACDHTDNNHSAQREGSSVSRARDKITKAVEAKGWQVETLIWEGLGPHVEKSGQEGGWFLEIMPNPEYEQNVPAFFTSYDNSGINVAAVLEMLNYVPDIKSG